MLDFLKSTEPLIPINDDPGVRAAKAPLMIAHAKLATLEADEHQLIRLVSGCVPRYTDEELEDAQQRLAVVKGTQNRRFLPEAEAQRQAVKHLTPPYEQAKATAKERLSSAGLAKLKPLVQHLAEVLHDAQGVARQIEDVCQEIGCGGCAKPEHPFPVLLPGEIISWQLEKAKERGLWT